MNIRQVGSEKRRGASKYLVILALRHLLPLPISFVLSHSGRGARGRRWLWAHSMGRSVALPLSSVRIFLWKRWPLHFSKTIFSVVRSCERTEWKVPHSELCSMCLLGLLHPHCHHSLCPDSSCSPLTSGLLNQLLSGLQCYPQEPMLCKVVMVTILKQLTNGNLCLR